MGLLVRIVVVEGPPATGKSTIIGMVVEKYGCIRVSYRRLGLVNIFFSLFLRTHRSDSARLCRRDPVVHAGIGVARRLSLAIFLLEVVYKAIIQLEVLATLVLGTVLRKRCIILDEFIILSIANYVNLYLKGIIGRRAFSVLVRLDAAFYKVILRYRPRYVFLRIPLRTILALHAKRCRDEYDYAFYVIVNNVSKYISLLGPRLG